MVYALYECVHLVLSTRKYCVEVWLLFFCFMYKKINIYHSFMLHIMYVYVVLFINDDLHFSLCVSFSLSLSLYLCLCLSVCLSVCLSLSLSLELPAPGYQRAAKSFSSRSYFQISVYECQLYPTCVCRLP